MGLGSRGIYKISDEFALRFDSKVLRMTWSDEIGPGQLSFSYSALAVLRSGIPGSASFHPAKKSW
jgi:hypothetical protein